MTKYLKIRYNRRIGENGMYPPTFFALAFHSRRENRNGDEHVNTDDDPSTSDKNLVNCDPATSEFTARVVHRRNEGWAGLHCMGFPRIMLHFICCSVGL